MVLRDIGLVLLERTACLFACYSRSKRTYIVRYVKIPTCSEAPIAINRFARGCAKASRAHATVEKNRGGLIKPAHSARSALMAFTYKCKLRIATGCIDVSCDSFGFSSSFSSSSLALPSFYNRTARVQSTIANACAIILTQWRGNDTNQRPILITRGSFDIRVYLKTLPRVNMYLRDWQITRLNPNPYGKCIHLYWQIWRVRMCVDFIYTDHDICHW